MPTINPSQIKSKLTKSQAAFLNFPTGFKCAGKFTVFQEMAVGGWSSGKTWGGMQKILFLAAYYPGNELMICRLHGADMVGTVVEEFLKQCPEGWIRKIQNRGRSNMIVHFVNGSIIYFKHIRDAAQKGTKSRRAGSNLGGFLVEQAEEITHEEWMGLCGRLRNSRAGVKFALGNANPAGSDWIQKQFFPNWKPLDPANGVFFRTYLQGNRIGIHIASEENRISNGGFVDDGFYDNVIQNQTKEFIDRYINASFVDFSGRIYKEYSLTSVHNIAPLARIPDTWECLSAIDVGGVCAWNVTKSWVDPVGNIIIAGEFDKATPLVSDVAAWIKYNTPVERSSTRFVIDPENKVAQTDLSLVGIFATPAHKNVVANIQRVSGYLHLVAGRRAPDWLADSQPDLAKRIAREGCPRIFVYDTCETWRNEHASVLWHEKLVNQIKKSNTERFDSVDSTGYLVAERPEARQLAQTEDPKLTALRAVSAACAAEFQEDLELQREANERNSRSSTRDMFSDGDVGEMSFAGARRAAQTIEWD
jgi:hypothetical protein